MFSKDMNAVSVSNLSKSYKLYSKPVDRLNELIVDMLKLRARGEYHQNVQVLQNLNFQIKRGETLGILGKNGAGKSTLLQILAGTLKPSNGQVTVNGRIAALLELGSGFNGEFTGKQNVYLNAALLGLSSDEIEKRYDDICAFADIGDYINRPIKTYSSGMIVRLAFAVIANVDADILIIDEALAVGDAYFNQKCMRYLRNFMEKGTVIFVSHDTGAIANLCNRAIYLCEGKIKLDGPPSDVISQYLEDIYANNQAVDVTKANLEKNHLGYSDVIQPVTEEDTLPDQDIYQTLLSEKSFGDGGAEIISTKIVNIDGPNSMKSIYSGSNVRLSIIIRANRDIFSPIVGFQFKDRLGQVIFGGNTYKTYADEPLNISAGTCFVANFEFFLPNLPKGEYSISPAIASGTQDNHVQHHWVHDMLIVNITETEVSFGLIGLRFSNIGIINA